jgi:hypothetical protein
LEGIGGFGEMKSKRSASIMRMIARLWVGGKVQSWQSLTLLKERRESRKPLVNRYNPEALSRKSQQTSRVETLEGSAKMDLNVLRGPIGLVTIKVNPLII